MKSKRRHRILALLVIVAATALVGCDKEYIEEQCQHAAIQKCGSNTSLLASACRSRVMKVCVKALCDVPFNECGVDARDALCADRDCNDPDDATYPDDDTWSYCGPDGYYTCDGEQCTLSSDTCPW